MILVPDTTTTAPTLVERTSVGPFARLSSKLHALRPWNIQIGGVYSCRYCCRRKPYANHSGRQPFEVCMATTNAFEVRRAHTSDRQDPAPSPAAPPRGEIALESDLLIHQHTHPCQDDKQREGTRKVVSIACLPTCLPGETGFSQLYSPTAIK